MAWRAWVPDDPPPAWRAILLGAALSVAASLLRLAIAAPLAGELPFITYFPALVVAAAFGGILGGGTCLILASAAAMGLFMPPEASPIWALISFWISGGLVVAVAAGMADTVRELRRSRGRLSNTEARLRTLVSELAHRNRNALTVIMALVDHSARGAASGAEAAHVINDRLAALARAQDLVLQADGKAVSLGTLIERALAPFGLDRFEFAAAADAHVSEDVASGLGLAFHELATNALKYGALSVPAGRVRISRTLEDVCQLVVWQEIGGPPVKAASHRGFGSRLLDAVLVSQGGAVQRRFDPAGLMCELRVPIALDDVGDARPAPGQALVQSMTAAP